VTRARRRVAALMTVALAVGVLAAPLSALADGAPANHGDPKANSVIATIPLPTNSFPEFVQVDRVRGVVWTAGPYSISAIREDTKQVIRTITLNSPTATVAHYPDAMTLDPRTGNVILGNTDPTLSIIDGRTGAIKVIDGVGSSTIFFARGVAVDPETGLIYVTNTKLASVKVPGFADSLITVVSERTGKVIDQIADPNGADAVVIDPFTHTVYVSNSNPDATFDKGSSVWVIDEKTNRVVDTIFEPSGYPNSMALDPIRGRLFITNLFNGPLTVINTRTRAVTAEVTLGTQVEPYPVTVDPANGMVYVDSYGDTNVWVVDGKTNKIVDTITVPITYGGLDVDPIRGLLWQNSDLEAGGATTSSIEAIKVAGSDDRDGHGDGGDGHGGGDGH
jgi:YVTN family beta-propeller protein